MLQSREEILIVDDEVSELPITKDICGEKFKVKGFSSASTMIDYILWKKKPKIIFLDIDMPEMDGYDTITYLKDNIITRDIPIVVMTAKYDDSSALKGINLGAVDYIPKPYLPFLIEKKVELHVEINEQKKVLKQQQAILETQNMRLAHFRRLLQMAVDESTGQIVGLQSAILDTVASLLERPGVDGLNRLKNQELAVLLTALQANGLYVEANSWDQDVIVQSSRLHDVGKIAIEEAILHKPDRLTQEEFETVKKHTVLGVDLLKSVDSSTKQHDFLQFAKVFAGTHHEKWDGSGYPFGLRGQSIPLAGRLMAIADVYDGLTSQRPYKKTFSHEEAVRVILQGRGTHFDPILVDVFAQVADDFKKTF
jgi:putative two-component system response regulator